MTKQLTGKQLRIPSGYRLSKGNVNNIVTVATRQLFCDVMIDHVRKESEIFNLIMDELYPSELLIELKYVARKLTRKKESINTETIQFASSLSMTINANEHMIGCRNYNWVYNEIKNGIADSGAFANLLKNLPEDKLKTLGVTNISGESNISQLSKLWFNCKYPFTDILRVSESNMFSVLSPNLRKKVKRFIEAREKLTTKIEEKRTLLRGIANAYTSSIKLCNDAPEFIKYINDSAIYNKDGKKCTDMSTIDMIAQLRK